VLNEFEININKQAKILVVGKSKGAKIYSYYRDLKNNYLVNAIKFFNARAEFITDITSQKSVKKEKLEILRTLIRGLMEIYSRILFIKNSDEKEVIKRIVGDTVYTAALLGNKISKPVELAYEANQIAGHDLPEFEVLCEWVSASNSKPESQDLRDFKRKFRFPPVKVVVNKYYQSGEESPIVKENFIYFYSIFSEQIHSNFYFEMNLKNDKYNPKYQLLAILIVIHLKFLKLTNELSGSNYTNKIELLIKEFLEFRTKAFELWMVSKS